MNSTDAGQIGKIKNFLSGGGLLKVYIFQRIALSSLLTEDRDVLVSEFFLIRLPGQTNHAK